MRNQKGITLIALILTIIIMTILAGISSSAIFGDNGIIQQAMRGKEKTENEAAKEMLELVWSARLTKYYEELSLGKSNAFSSYFSKDLLNEELSGNGQILKVTPIDSGNSYDIIYQDNQGNNFQFTMSNAGKATLIEDHIDVEIDIDPGEDAKSDLYGTTIETGVTNSNFRSDKWRVLYIDDSSVYLIYSGYVGRWYPDISTIWSRNFGAGVILRTKDDVDDDYFINTAHWQEIENLLSGSGSVFEGKTIVANGAPTLEIWTASVNEKYGGDLSKDEDYLYILDWSEMSGLGDCPGYFLATPSEEDERYFLVIDETGEIVSTSLSLLRPVVSISKVDFQDATGIVAE